MDFDYTNIGQIRNKCKQIAIRRGFNMDLFGRIPMYIFKYFSLPDPLCGMSYAGFDHIMIPVGFMIVNKISLRLFYEWYLTTPKYSSEWQTFRFMVEHYLDLYFADAWQSEFFNKFNQRYFYNLEHKRLESVWGHVVVKPKKQKNGRFNSWTTCGRTNNYRN